MSLIAKCGDRLLAVADRLQSAPDEWLIGLRWLATAGMLVTILCCKLVVPGLRLIPLLVIMGALAVMNLFWLRLGRRQPRRAMLGAQIAFDLIILGLLLWHSGGLDNPFAPFLAFQVVLAGLLTSSRLTVSIAALTVVIAAVLHGAPALPLEGVAVDPERVRTIGRLVAVVLLGAFLGFFVWLFARRAEQLIEERARNEKLAALGRTVAALCHELNTPLGTIQIAGKDLENLSCAAPPDVAGQMAELARAVTQSASRASDIISLLRGAVRPSVRTEPVELGAFVRQVVEGELDRLGYRGERAIRAPLTMEVRVLPTALAQILANLLSNAVEALRDVAEPRIEVVVMPRSNGVDVCIEDNGHGVSPGLLPRLGEPFQTTKEEGMGLGLYVSSLLAERMGGRLLFDSRPGAGARLTLSLDAAPRAAAA